MAKNISKSSAPKRARAWQGPVIFSYGFRPFFLFAPAFALLAIINWLLIQAGSGIEPASITARDWHIHEMLFGYTSAAIAGFLLTAVPNWTGRYPVTGWPLAGLAAVWLAGRLAMLTPWDMPYGVLATVDAAFLPLLAAMIAREILSGKNWRNIKVLLPVTILAGANIWFQAAIWSGADSAGAVRLGFGAVLFLIMLIGGRIIPSFTRNWLARQGAGRLPVAFNRFDAVAVITTAVGLLWWVALAPSPALAVVLIVAAVLQGVRLSRWAGYRSLSNPLILVLHVFYAFLPLGILTLGVAILADDPAITTAALHLLGIGAIAGMTMTVMLRATLGHTGRAVVADRATGAMFSLLALAAFLRAIAALLPELDWLITLSGLFWIAAFGLFTFWVGPWLLKRRLGKG
jgi:uncharacterized protein involved in response to NO